MSSFCSWCLPSQTRRFQRPWSAAEQAQSSPSPIAHRQPNRAGYGFNFVYTAVVNLFGPCKGRPINPLRLLSSNLRHDKRRTFTETTTSHFPSFPSGHLGSFEKRDRASESKYGISARYESQRSRDMKENCGKWALEPTATWDPSILGEVLNLMQFLMNFLGDLKVLKDACHNNGTKTINLTGDIYNYEQIAVAQRKQDRVWNAISRWLDENPEFSPNLSENTTISAASFRELFIRNRLHGLQIRLIGGKKYKNLETKLKKEIEKIASDTSMGYPFMSAWLIHRLEKILGDKLYSMHGYHELSSLYTTSATPYY